MQNKPSEPRLATLASWAVLAASFGLSASTWISLAVLSGFTGHFLRLPLAWLMPVAVDGYVVTALVLWMSPVPQKLAQFARTNTYVAASIGVMAQSAYHALFIWSTTHVLWRAVMAAIVGALPPAVAALAVHMRAILHRELTHPGLASVQLAGGGAPLVAGLDMTVLTESLNEASMDGPVSGNTLAAALQRRGYPISSRDARRLLVVMRPKQPENQIEDAQDAEDVAISKAEEALRETPSM